MSDLPPERRGHILYNLTERLGGINPGLSSLLKGVKMRRLTFIISIIIPTYLAAAQWTVMVYLNGDNNLETYAIQDFNEMEMVGSSSDVNIIVQFDRALGYNHSNGDWTTCRRYLVLKDEYPDSITSALIEDLGEVDMGSPSILADFGTWAKQNYPAAHYLLVIWNHGDGWKQIGPLVEAIKGVSYDESSGNYISVANGELAQALSAISDVDIIGFDACLMQMWEVMVNVSPYASCMVGSEETESAYGWNYTRFLQELDGNPTMDPITLGKSIINNTYQKTLSVVDLDMIEDLTQAVDTFALELMRARDQGYTDTIKSVRNRTQNFYEWSYIDLYDFAKNIKLANVPELLKTTASLVIDGVDVVVKATNNSYANAHGISVYHPSSPTYYMSSYSGLEVAELTRWDEYLKGCMFNDSLGIYGGIGNNWAGLDTIRYDGVPYSFWGYEEDTSFYAGVRFTPTKACTIKAVLAFLNYGFDYELYIYDVDQYSMPNTILHTQSGASHYGWNYIELTTPVVRESAGDFWVAIYTQNAYFPIGVDNGAWSAHRTYCSFDGLFWEEICENGVYYNFNIRAEVKYPQEVIIAEHPKSEIQSPKLMLSPNPFRNNLRIGFSIESGSATLCGRNIRGQVPTLRIYDSSGRLIRNFSSRLTMDSKPFMTITWDGTDNLGNHLPAGIYFVRLTTEKYQETKKVILLRK